MKIPQKLEGFGSKAWENKGKIGAIATIVVLASIVAGLATYMLLEKYGANMSNFAHQGLPKGESAVGNFFKAEWPGIVVGAGVVGVPLAGVIAALVYKVKHPKKSEAEKVFD